MKKSLLKAMTALCITFTLTFSSLPTTAMFTTYTCEAHSGRTDSNGGHKDNKNKSGLGSYHFHCNGNPPHLHKNGVCPYNSNSTSKSSSSSNVSKSTIKKVQQELNSLGYSCGTPDGIHDKKSKAALKEYQKDKGLTVDGKIGNEVLKSLGLK